MKFLISFTRFLVMRKTYETDKDRSNEGKIADLIHEKWEVNLVKLPVSYNLDYAMLNICKDCKLCGFLEVKVRSLTKSYFSLYMISLAKVIKARELTKITGLPSLLVVQWEDEAGWISFSAELQAFGIGGRKDRNDWQDQEPITYFKTHEFNQIERRKT